MHWIAPSEKDAANDTLEKRLWAAAEQANTRHRQTANLRRTRDLLLPRLLSGEVNLREA